MLSFLPSGPTKFVPFWPSELLFHLRKFKVLRIGRCRGILFEPIPLVSTLIDHIDKLVSPILDASTFGVKRSRTTIDDPTSAISLREKIDMDQVIRVRFI